MLRIYRDNNKLIMRISMMFVCMMSFFSSIVSCQENKHKELKAGDNMPAFTLADQDGKIFNSNDYSSKNYLVIFFYPKDESMVCTKEACAFRDMYSQFKDAGAIVVGINNGSMNSHKKFETNSKLSYPLLIDTANNVLHAFGVPDKFFMTGRETFVIDKTGKIVFTYDASLQGRKHAEEALAYLKNHK
jgi:thioredoxin-dependent peroxiredoxin